MIKLETQKKKIIEVDFYFSKVGLYRGDALPIKCSVAGDKDSYYYYYFLMFVNWHCRFRRGIHKYDETTPENFFFTSFRCVYWITEIFTNEKEIGRTVTTTSNGLCLWSYSRIIPPPPLQIPYRSFSFGNGFGLSSAHIYRDTIFFFVLI